MIGVLRVGERTAQQHIRQPSPVTPPLNVNVPLLLMLLEFWLLLSLLSVPPNFTYGDLDDAQVVDQFPRVMGNVLRPAQIHAGIRTATSRSTE